MTQLKDKSPKASPIPEMEKAIPMATLRIGSRETLISRRRLSTTELAKRYAAISSSWERTARRFQLNVAYREPLVTSQIATVLARGATHAPVLDCGIGNGSLSMSVTNRFTLRPVLVPQARHFGRGSPSDLPLFERFPMLRLRRSECALFGFIFVYSFIPAFGGLIRILELAGGPQIAPANPRALLAPTPIILHILSSFVFCIVGAFQFLPSIRRQRPGMHRKIGRVIAAAGSVSALSGLWMTHVYVFPEALQGTPLYWVRIVLGTAMLGLIIWAVIAIRSRKVPQHSAAMLRAYAIGQGASTQTVLGIAWIIIVGSEAMGPLRDGLMTFAWVLNLLVAEILIRSMRRPAKRPRENSVPPVVPTPIPRNET